MDSLDTSMFQQDSVQRLDSSSKLSINNTTKYTFQRPQMKFDLKSPKMTESTQSDTDSNPANKPNVATSSRMQNSNVFSLNYSKRDLCDFPKFIFDYSANLLILDLSKNRFADFPAEIAKLNKLKTLKADHNMLKKFPNEICQLQNLENLSLSYNQITQIPKNIQKLTKCLSILNLGHNQIESIPKELTDLKNLRSLFLQYNSFTTIPTSLVYLTSLKEFGLDWFKYANPTLSVNQSEKTKFAPSKLFQLCKTFQQSNKPDIDFESFINHFSLSYESYIDQKDPLQRNMLHLATLEEELGIIKYLAAKKPNLINQIDHDKQTPLSLAIREEKYHAARILLQNGADPRLGGGAFGSALHLASTKLHVSLVKDLLKCGADPNAIDLEKSTALHLLFSIFSKDSFVSAEISHLLIDHGADPNAKNTDGWAPIHLAVRRGQVDCIRWIIKQNLRMKYENKEDRMFDLNILGGSDKWSPLHLAASLGHFEIIHLLLEQDADLMARTRTGKSIRDVATNNLIISKMIKKVEKEWMGKNLFRSGDLSHKLKEVTGMSNVQSLKNMINLSSGKAIRTSENTMIRDRITEYRTEGNDPLEKILPLAKKVSSPTLLKSKPKQQVKGDKDITEDSLLLNDVDETVDVKETLRAIPRSPNNIQKIQIAQNYRNHLLCLSAQKERDDLDEDTPPSVKYPTLLFGEKDYRTPTKNLTGSFVKHEHRVSSFTASTLQSTKFTFPTEFDKYIKSFDSYEDEIKRFQHNVLDDTEPCLAEKLKHLFFLKVIHMKMSREVKKLQSEMIPMELFIVCEFIDDEFRRMNYVVKKNKSILDSENIPRRFLFIFENLENTWNSASSVMKTYIAQYFGEIKYFTSLHFLKQLLHMRPPNHLFKYEIELAIKKITEKNESNFKFITTSSNITTTQPVKVKSYISASASKVTTNTVHRTKINLFDKCENVDDEDSNYVNGVNSTKSRHALPKNEIVNHDDEDESNKSKTNFSVLATEGVEYLKLNEIQDTPKKLRVNGYFTND
jgi:ankyrin repeat protein